MPSGRFEWLADGRDVILCALAAGIGLIALQPSGSPLLLILLALFWGHASTRASAFFVGFAFCFSSAASLPTALSNFFPNLSPLLATSTWIAYASVGAAAFAACWVAPKAGLTRRLISGVILLTVLAVPPVGAVFWGHPVLAAAEFFPGMGLAGIALTVVLWSLLGSLRFPPTSTGSPEVMIPTGSSDVAAWLIGISVVSAVVRFQVDVAGGEHATPHTISSTLGADFNLGRTSTNQVAQYRYLADEVLPTIKSMSPPAGAVVLLPESIAGVNTSARLQWWRGELDEFFSQNGTLVVGEYDEHGKGMAVISKTGYRYYPARQSTPLAEWTLEGSYQAFGMWSNVAILRTGSRYALVNCYEALTVWPLLLDLAKSPDAILFGSNQFWAKGTRAPDAMSSAMQSWAKIAGVPLVSAVNR